MKKSFKLAVVFFLAFAASIQIGMATASFQVTAFSCSPSEAVINSLFSCTATIQNAGDASGTLNTATLYPDSGNWLEDSNYPQAYGQSVNAGNSISVTFSGLRATKSGNNGFTRIMLDSVTDTFVADNNKKVNVVNVAVIVSNSASSAAMNGEVTATTEVTAGGNIDVSLSFASSSGGCSIGSQTNPKAISGMTDGSKQSRTWTITQGTSGDCQFSISAAATGGGGVASKIDTTSSTITCTDCPAPSSSSGGSGGGGGGGGGAAAATVNYDAGPLLSAFTAELALNEKASFNISGGKHVITLKNVTETGAVITVESKEQTFAINVGNTISVDLNENGIKDISVYLKSINIISKKANLIIAPLVFESGGREEGSGSEGEKSLSQFSGKNSSNKIIGIALIGIFVLLAVLICTRLIARKYGQKRFERSVLMGRFFGRQKINSNKLQ